MTDEDKWIEEAKARCAAASPGPWAQPSANVFRVIAWKDGKPVLGVVESPDEHFYYGQQDLMTYREGERQCFDDRAFIAHARTDLPRALDALTEARSLSRRQAEEIARLRAALEEARGCFIAAYAEGLYERIAEADDGTGTLRDLVERRLLHAMFACDAALSPLPIATEIEGK